ncbi:EAL domain-containing protein [Desulfurobacterium crinifex]
MPEANIFHFKNIEEIIKDFPIDKYRKYSRTLAFVFCTSGPQELVKCGEFLSNALPNAKIVGTTTAGTIVNSKIYDSGITIAIVHFQDSNVYIAFAEEKSEFLIGKEIAEKIPLEEEGFLILLSDGTFTIGEELLKGIFEIRNVPLIGGKASTKDFSLKTAVLVGNKLIYKGAVGVFIASNKRNFEMEYLFDWREIGTDFLVTHSQGNRVFSINHLSAVEFYEKYLGKEVAKELPLSGIEYPLVFTRDNLKLARACIKKHKDGSLSFSGTIPEGEKVRLAFGSLRERDKHINRFHSLSLRYDFFFIFSCYARRKFLGKAINEELRLFSSSLNCGFFTFGEYFSNHLLNETTTVIGLESNGKERKRKRKRRKKTNKQEKSLLSVLTNLVSEITNEYELLNEAIDHSKFGLLILNEVNGKKVCIFASKGLSEITGYRVEDFVLGRIDHSIIHPEDRKKIEILKDKLLKGEITSLKVEYRILLPNGEEKWIRSFVKVLQQGKEIVISFSDITAEKKLKEEKKKSEYLAFHDSLTGLYSKNFIREIIPKIIAQNQRKSTYSAILFIDLDNFKLINDVYGHDIGDEVLKKIGERIRTTIREMDIACRLGGDEFLVLILDLGNKAEAYQKTKSITQRLLQKISQPIKIKINGREKEFLLTCSIGVVVFSSEYSFSELLRYADTAMYAAKHSGRNRTYFFNCSLKSRVEFQEKIESHLRKRLAENGLKVFYQPQVYVEKLGQEPKIIGAEALVRWIDSELGDISPSIFIPIAEEAGIIEEVGYFVLERVCNCLRNWQRDSRRRNWRLSVNVSYYQLLKENFLKEVKKLVKEFSIPPSKLQFEITENVLIKDIEIVVDVLNALKSIGFSISIDDFGTGYSWLSYLQKLPIDEIKIDRSFVTDLDTDFKKQRLVKAIISLGNALQLDIVAEGVETQKELQTLLNLGCNLFQGYLFGKPVEKL